MAVAAGRPTRTLGRRLEQSQSVKTEDHHDNQRHHSSIFRQLKQKSGGETFLADGMAFTSFVTPIKLVMGKSAYLESTSRFFSMITAVEVKDLIVDGDSACALTRYQLQPPGGPAI